jgi:hypothetical protein
MPHASKYSLGKLMRLDVVCSRREPSGAGGEGKEQQIPPVSLRSRVGMTKDCDAAREQVLLGQAYATRHRVWPQGISSGARR